MSDSNVATSPYSRILAVEVFNFMSIEHGRVEFDESNIINLKGYNDSGKSGILTALKVALLNANPSKQASFIQDDKDYFRVVVYFADGVQLLRDKYINGQSLYEMYKDGQCVYTTKSGKALTRVNDVPEPIANYLGLVTFDGGALNARSCFEKQLGVQTTGAENYRMFNTVLKSEEIATAGILLNNDKNKLASDINAIDVEIQAQKAVLGEGDKLTDNMIAWLKSHDAVLDACEMQIEKLTAMYDLANQLADLVVYPELPEVDTTQLDTLGVARATANALDRVVITPELPSVDNVQLDVIINIGAIASSLAQIRPAPEVPTVDGKEIASLVWILDAYTKLSEARVAPEVASVDAYQLDMLGKIVEAIESVSAIDEDAAQIEKNLGEMATELVKLQKEAENHGRRMVKCPNCGELFDPELMHQHA